MRYIELAFVIVCVVAIVQVLGRRVPLPAPLLLVGCGVLLSGFAHLDSLDDQAPLAFVLLVPPLLYIEAWLCPKRELLDAIGPVFGLAIGLVAATVLVVAYGSQALLPSLGLGAAFALGSALAPTDTVAVATLTRSALLTPRLKTLLGGEGLFNDAVALVVFQFAVQGVTSRHFGPGRIASEVVVVVGGGVLTGAGVAWIGSQLRRLLISVEDADAPVDVLLSLMTPYAAYLAGDKLGVSGVLAVVVAGLLAGVLDKRHLTPRLRLQGKPVWTTVQFALNGAVFVLLGLETRQVLARLVDLSASRLLLDSLLLTAALVLIRAIWLAGAVFAFGMQLHSGPGRRRAPETFRHVTLASLCGVRGTLTLTAALSVPLVTTTGIAFPGRDLLVALAAGTVLTTLGLHAVVCFFVRTDKPVEPPEAPDLATHVVATRAGTDRQRDELERRALASMISEESRRRIEEELDIIEIAHDLIESRADASRARRSLG